LDASAAPADAPKKELPMTAGETLPGLPVTVDSPALPELVQIDARDEDLLSYVHAVQVDLVLDNSAKGSTAQLLVDTVKATIDPAPARADDRVNVRYDALWAFKSGGRGATAATAAGQNGKKDATGAAGQATTAATPRAAANGKGTSNNSSVNTSS